MEAVAKMAVRAIQEGAPLKPSFGLCGAVKELFRASPDYFAAALVFTQPPNEVCRNP